MTTPQITPSVRFNEPVACLVCRNPLAYHQPIDGPAGYAHGFIGNQDHDAQPVPEREFTETIHRCDLCSHIIGSDAAVLVCELTSVVADRTQLDLGRRWVCCRSCEQIVRTALEASEDEPGMRAAAWLVLYESIVEALRSRAIDPSTLAIGVAQVVALVSGAAVGFLGDDGVETPEGWR